MSRCWSQVETKVLEVIKKVSTEVTSEVTSSSSLRVWSPGAGGRPIKCGPVRWLPSAASVWSPENTENHKPGLKLLEDFLLSVNQSFILRAEYGKAKCFHSRAEQQCGVAGDWDWSSLGPGHQHLGFPGQE